MIRGVLVNPEVIRGKSAYEIAVEHRFDGTKEEWLESLKGKSAYELAVDKGYEGTEDEWLESITEEATKEAEAFAGEAKSARDEAEESAKAIADVLEDVKQNLTVDGETLMASFATV